MGYSQMQARKGRAPAARGRRRGREIVAAAMNAASNNDLADF